MKKKICSFLVLIFLINMVIPLILTGRASAAFKDIQYYKDLPEDNELHIPESVPGVNSGGKAFNSEIWEDVKYRLIVYGYPQQVPGNERKFNKDLGTWEYRYLGFDQADNPFSNDRFPDDATSSKPMADKDWIFEPWEILGFTPTPYSVDKRCEEEINRMAEYLGWSPGNKGIFYGYGNVQSYPTLLARGSFRMWHRASDGKIWYDTQYMPQLEYKLDTPFEVETEIVSSDFTIDEDESFIDVSVKVTAHLKDESYMADEVQKAIHYNREDIKEWYLKVEYKGTEVVERIKGTDKNVESKTFNLKLSRNLVTDGERIQFNGVGRVVFHNDEYYRDSDAEDVIVTVVPTQMDLPPDLMIDAPQKANVTESFTVEVKPFVPEGESVTSISLEHSFNGGPYQNIPLTNNKATVSYMSEGTVDYRASVTISNGNTTTATAVTQIVDERSADCKADVLLSDDHTYEGHYITAYNRNKFYFDGQSYDAEEADSLGLGSSCFYVYDSSEYELESDLYRTRDWDVNDSTDIAFLEPGEYKIGCEAYPRNGEPDEDIEAVTVSPCPHIKHNLVGSRKHNRKLTLDFSGTITHPDYPLDNSKTCVEIEDLETREKVKITNNQSPDSAHIKTLPMVDNAFDFLIKAPEEKAIKITIYVEDTRGESDTRIITTWIKPDLPPVAEITASLVQYRGTDGVAKIKVGKSGYSPDGDRLTVNNLKYKVDTDNDGNFDDEVMNGLSDNLIVLEADITTDRVGRILFDYTVKEDLTPETIPQFVTEDDYLTHHTTKIVDVDNLQPHTALRAIGSHSMDLLMIGEKDDVSTLQTKVAELQNNLNSTGTPVDLNGEVKGADFSSELIKEYDVAPRGIDYKRWWGNSDNCYVYSDYNNNFYIREFETGNLIKYIPNMYRGMAETSSDWVFVLDNMGWQPDLNSSLTKYYFLNTKTGEYLTGEFLFWSQTPRFNEKSKLLYFNDYGIMFDAVNGTFVDINGLDLGDIRYREGDLLYYIKKTTFVTQYPIYKAKYTLYSFNIATKDIKEVSSYTTQNGLFKNEQGLHVQYQDEDNIAIIYDYMRSSRMNVAICDFKSKTFTHFTEFALVPYIYDEYNKRFNLYGHATIDCGSAKFVPDLDNSRMYVNLHNIYMNNDGRTYYMPVGWDYKITAGSVSAPERELFRHKRDEYSEIKNCEYDYWIDFYKNRFLSYNVKRHNSVDPYFHIYDENLNPLDDVVFSDSHDYFRKPPSAVYNQYLKDPTLKTYYYVIHRSDDDDRLRYYYYNHELGRQTYRTLIFTANDEDLSIRGRINANGKEWLVVAEIKDAWDNYFVGLHIIDTTNNQRYYSDIIAGSDYPLKIIEKNGIIWVFTEIRMCGFNTETKEFYEPSDVGITSPGIAKLFVTDPSNKYLHEIDWHGDASMYVFLDQLKDDVKEHLNSFTLRDYSQKYICLISDNALSLSSSDITYVSDLIKSKGLECIWIGNSDNQTSGEAIVPETGGTVLTYSSYDNAFSQLEDYLTANMPPKNSAYVTEIKKGEAIAYDKYFFDLEGDSQIPSTIQWYYRHIPGSDGLASFNETWLDSPVTSFEKDGIYYVSWRVNDNPKPADTDSRFASYRKYSVREEMMIIVGDTEAPEIQVVDPELDLRIGGTLKVNRKVTIDLDIVLGTNAIDYNKTLWEITPVSGGTQEDIKVKDITNISKHLLFKHTGTYHIKATIEDVKGNTFSAETDVYIYPDEPIAGSIAVDPGTAYRDLSGAAKVNVTVQADSNDDYIEYIKYYLIYDSNNDGSFEDEMPVELIDKQNLTQFELEVANGVGSYRVLAVVKEGYLEDTIPEFITEDDYYKLNLNGNFTVDNIKPIYDIRPHKDVYLVGEDIRYISNLHGAMLDGDVTKGYFDDENDPMSYIKARYIQDKTVINIQDETSAYHNIELSDLLHSLDRAGLYSIEVKAGDDPKPGDSRFAPFRRDSNTSISNIIVHRRPVAEALLQASNPEADVFSFGDGIYLEGTRLKIIDRSYDPDGFAVSTRLSYKAGNGDYIVINSGDVINLEYGSTVTVKVETEDNWGASDTELYTVNVVNGLDMQAEVIPSPVPAGEEITLRLITNQYAESAGVNVFGRNLPLLLVSETEEEKVWEARYHIEDTRRDGYYNARFRASSEGVAELYKDKGFTVRTPINLFPSMPDTFVTEDTVEIKAVTTKYAYATRVVLYKGTEFETELGMEGNLEGDIKEWHVFYEVPEPMIEGNYIAEFTAATPNGNTEAVEVAFSVQSLKITGVTLEGCWNHWRGQVDMFGDRMANEPHRFLCLERVKINVYTSGFADKVVIRFSPELEAMTFTDELGRTYDYKGDFTGYYVSFPEDSTFVIDQPKAVDHLYWEYVLPLAPSTKTWDNVRKRGRYKMTVYAYKGEKCASYVVDNIDITGNIYDLTHIQPID